MSNIAFVDEGCYLNQVAWLAYLTSKNATIRLCKTNFAPADSDVLADYTPGEADFDGYAGIVLTGGGVSNLGGGLGARIDWDPVTWTPTGAVTPNDIYSYYVTDDAQTELYWSGPCDVLPSTLNGGSTSLTIPVRFGEKSQF